MSSFWAKFLKQQEYFFSVFFLHLSSRLEPKCGSDPDFNRECLGPKMKKHGFLNGSMEQS